MLLPNTEYVPDRESDGYTVYSVQNCFQRIIVFNKSIIASSGPKYSNTIKLLSYLLIVTAVTSTSRDMVLT